MSLAMMQYRLDSLKTNIIIGANKVGGEVLYRKNLARVSMGIKGNDKRKIVDPVPTKEELLKEMEDKKESKEAKKTVVINGDGTVDVEIKEISSEPVKNELAVQVRRLSEDEVEIIDPIYDPVFLTDDELDENIEEAYKLVRGEGRQIKLLILSVFYIAGIVKPEQVFSRCKTEDDLIFINSVVKFYSGVPVLPQYSTLSINEVVSIGLLKKVIDYEAACEIEDDNDALYAVIKKTEELLVAYERKNLNINGKHDEEPGVPVFFTQRNMNLTGNHGVSKAVINKLEKEFGELLANNAYQFNKLGDMIELVIYDNGRMDSYIIDPGTVIGNGFNVMCNVPGDTIMVNQKHKDILQKVFQNPQYVLSGEEIQRVCHDMFLNPRIYYMVDMSKGPEFLPKLSEEEFVRLGKKLSFILNIPWDPNEIPFGRLRFRSFKSVDDFTLVSDDKCKSPLVDNNETCGFISPGLVVKIENDQVTIKNEEKSKQFKIEEYNAL